MTGFESKRSAAQDKLNDEADTLTIVYQRGFADGKRSAQRKPLTEEQIFSVLEKLQMMYHRPPTTDSRVVLARAIEAAHNIKEGNI